MLQHAVTVRYRCPSAALMQQVLHVQQLSSGKSCSMATLVDQGSQWIADSWHAMLMVSVESLQSTALITDS